MNIQEKRRQLRTDLREAGLPSSLQVLKGCEDMVRQALLVRKFRPELVRGDDGQAIRDGGTHWVLSNRKRKQTTQPSIVYPYEADVWCADCLPRGRYHRLLKLLGPDARWFDDEAEYLTKMGKGDESTIHFAPEHLLAVARVLRLRRRKKPPSAKQRAAAQRNIVKALAARGISKTI